MYIQNVDAATAVCGELGLLQHAEQKWTGPGASAWAAGVVRAGRPGPDRVQAAAAVERQARSGVSVIVAEGAQPLRGGPGSAHATRAINNAPPRSSVDAAEDHRHYMHRSVIVDDGTGHLGMVVL